MTKLADIIAIRDSLNNAIIENAKALRDDSGAKYDSKKVKFAQRKFQLQLFKSLDLDPLRFENLFDFDDMRNKTDYQNYRYLQRTPSVKRVKRAKYDSSRNTDSINKRNFYFNDKVKRMFK